jgi:hypothetical protein
MGAGSIANFNELLHRTMVPPTSFGTAANGATGTITPISVTDSTFTTGLNQYLTSNNGMAYTPTGAFSTTGTGVANGTPAGATGTATTTNDQRLRLAHLPGYQVSGGSPYSGIQQPLAATNGLMFPYTPTVQFSQEVDYAHLAMVHSNTDYYSFTRSQNSTFSITAKFTVQNQSEGQYVMAAIQFLRTVSKMNFGQNDTNAGLPPPILTLSGYGTYMLNGVRVFLKSHSYSFEDNMDLVKVTVGSGTVYLPALFTVSLSLVVQQTPRAMRQDFTLDKYRDGSLLASGGWV